MMDIFMLGWVQYKKKEYVFKYVVVSEIWIFLSGYKKKIDNGEEEELPVTIKNWYLESVS